MQFGLIHDANSRHTLVCLGLQLLLLSESWRKLAWNLQVEPTRALALQLDDIWAGPTLQCLTLCFLIQGYSYCLTLFHSG